MERVVLPPSAPLGTPPVAVTTPPAPLRNQPNPFRNDQYWDGSYTCAQGETDLTLHITRVNGNDVDAEFQFEVVSNGTSGSYRVMGTYDPGRATIAFRAGAWISRPAGYEPVDLHGVVNTNGERVEGTIDHTGCGAFTIDLEEDEDYD